MTVLIIALCAAAFCLAQTDISGDISGVLTAAGSPYRVIGDIRVAPHTSLIIEPGVTLEFQVPPYHKFVVDTGAVLKAIGTETDSIVFTAANTIIGWLGIRFFYADIACSLAYCRIEYGKARGSAGHETYGGGVYCIYSDIKIANCTFYGDSAEGAGGAIACLYSSVLIQNNTIINCVADIGGGIHCNGNGTIKDNTISGNVACERGGGIYCCDSTVVLNNTISHNSVIGSGSNKGGGGIFCQYYVKIENNYIANNSVLGGDSGDQYRGGGGIYYKNSPPPIYGDNAEIISNLIVHNYLDSYYDDGGGIYCYLNTTPWISNCLIMDNETGGNGGGLYCYDNSDPTIINCTITGNLANRGGALSCGNDCDIVIINTIMYDDTATLGASYGNEIYNSACDIYLAFNDVDSNDCRGYTDNIHWCGGNIDVNPLFADSLCHLSATSPCINTGSGWAYIASLDSFIYADSIDYEGDLRPLNGAWEIGCDEVDTLLISIWERYKKPTRFNLSVFPNPFNSAVSITAPAGAEIEIFDINGRMVYKTSIGAFRETPVIWQTDAAIGSGIYLVRAIRGEQEVTKRIVYLK